MATTQPMNPEQLGVAGEPCRECGSPLAGDQRYCLNCGRRRTGPRLEYAERVGTVPTQAAPATAGELVTTTGGPPPRDMSPFAAVGAIAVLGLILLVGVLIGKSAESDPGATTAAAPIVRLDGGGGNQATAGDGAGAGNSETASNETFKSDWPSGKTGFTIELGTLPKQGTSAAQVAAQEEELAAQGAKDVGALDSDQYGSLPAGNYVLYSGVYDTKPEATKALGKLKADFPDATVIKVAEGAGASATAPVGKTVDSLDQSATGGEPVTASDEALEELNSASGEDYAEQSEELPDVIATEGKPPPTDNQAPGGDSGGGGIVIE